MHTTDEQSWDRDDLYEAIASEIDAAYIKAGPRGALTVTVRNFDVPACVSNGILYIQIPFLHLLEAVAASIPASLCNMETGISAEGGTALSLDRIGTPLPESELVVESVVRDGKQR
jgi:hypothetical protein